MNPNYAKHVKEELDKLLKVGFIYPVEAVTWLSPIVIVPKKNGKLRICVDYRKLNAAGRNRSVSTAFSGYFISGSLDV